MFPRAARRALLQASCVFKQHQKQQQQQHLLLGAAAAWGTGGSSSMWGPTAAGCTVNQQQTRSKWWWSRTPADEAQAGPGPEVMLGSDGPADLFDDSNNSSGSSSSSGGVIGGSSSSTAAGAGDAAASGAVAAAAGAANADAMSAGEVLDAASAVVEATGAAEAAALVSAKASVWSGTQGFIDLMDWSHAGLGMPWWEAIFVSNMVVRLATFPFTVFTQKKSGRMTELRAHSQRMQDLYQQASKAQTLAEYERYQAQIAAAQETLRTQYGKDAKWALIMPGIALLNMSVFVSQFSAVKTLADEGLPSMTNEGIAWFADLTLPDPYYGLPVLCAALTLAMVESGAMSAEMGQAQTAQTLKWVMRFFALIFIPLGAYMPSAVALLWFSNSIFSLAQASVLRSKVLRHKLGLPDLAAMQAAAAAAAAGPPSPIMQKINELMGTPAAQGATSSTGSGASGSSSGGAAAAAAAGVVSKSSSGGSAPPPPGTRPSRLLTNKPAGWKRKKA